MNQPDREQRLIAFALATLRIMQDDHDWSSDTLEAIAAEAGGCGLTVEGGEDGYFAARPEVLG